ncbi:HPr family phosphocarrier protein [Fusibacter ferrireducens]|uniref:HPr family phosphocarrier protein n=1 Tax=Fusibacter ferrireducens TaxID=2785058 RepID=A0ABR9ZXU4_9FIRM|nr:HPr family phosphocarrier protein [Fusibacter ferrireducens]MBF4695288.1 HPr family phosphocarrier protein [Fusibacter ferrireducens]
MKNHEFTLQNEHGLHARPAGLFVQVCNKYQSAVNLYKADQKYNGKSMLGILKMAASKGDVIRVEVDGVDESEAIDEIKSLIRGNFGE